MVPAVVFISIHALREESDACEHDLDSGEYDFYPRPPRGERLNRLDGLDKHGNISIHALREESDNDGSCQDCAQQISIHALREESDEP